ncbi:MAG: hypothetical protein DMF00_12075 [Verrucomicrobia bacterium]|nr:MAG: hypothetical protein DMF00_12075 [Verrucomicrobiota bacterium]
MKKKQKLVSDRIVEELIKQATERAARDLGISTRKISAPNRQNMCAAATQAYDNIKNRIETTGATGGGGKNQYADLIMAGVAMHAYCDPE